jgi:phenylpropionate dioxygenase-like ring-hydroxylating dioxygenase large terminal subunit
MNDVQTIARGGTETLQTQVPLAAKLTPEFFEQERDKIFRRSWLIIGHAVDLPQPGCYFVRDLPTLNTSLLVIRGEDGRVRAFHNICRHRGNKIVREGAGCRNSFRCNFHGWVYAPDGSLTVVTDEHQFKGLDKSTLGLLAVHTEVWEGLIFVNLDREPRWTLAEWLGEMHGEFRGYFESHEKIATHAVDTRSNWNLGVNSFNEGYHTLYIHRNTVPDYQGGRVNPERHRPFMQMMPLHFRYSAPANPDHRLTPAEQLAVRVGRPMLPASVLDGQPNHPPGVNPSRTKLWLFDVLHIFPNFVWLNGHHWHIEMYFWPLSHERTWIEQQTWAYKATTIGERISQEFFRTRGREVFREDLNTLEAQHAALASGVMPYVQLSLQEIAISHHYKVCDEFLRHG